jgi:adenylate cyclase
VVVPQVGVALLWAILCTSLKLYVDKQVLAESLAYNLSPACVKEILKRPDLLRPGATKQEVSVLFSDIAGFSKITGRMDPDDLFALLNKYYDAALTGIHQTDGTVLQLIGDAIFAVWNAPLPQADHHVRACRAALTLRDQLLQFDVRQQSLPLRTRVGLHAGTASVGNLGSANRFEYSAIGDNTNLASRLEGLNKQLGTEILASRDIQKHVESTLLCRLVGHFKFKGVDRLLEVHELLGSLELAEPTRAWREAFARGLFHFQRRQFDAAEAQFKLASQLRCESTATPTTACSASMDDGPSLFYLAKIEVFRKEHPSPEWNGEIELTEK